MVVNIYRHRTKDFLTESSKNNYERTSGQLTICTTARAVKTFSTSRLVMNSRQLWNSHQLNKFLRAKASKDILQFRVSEMAFLGVFKRYFPLQMPCCFVKATKTGNDAVDVSQTFQDRMVWTFHRSKPFKYAFNVIRWCLFFVSSYNRRRWR